MTVHEPSDDARPELPGLPLPSGFDNWRRGPKLSPEATARVLAKIDSVNQARARAYVSSLTAVLG